MIQVSSPSSFTSRRARIPSTISSSGRSSSAASFISRATDDRIGRAITARRKVFRRSPYCSITDGATYSFAGCDSSARTIAWARYPGGIRAT